ncbi:EAL domain-containing protein [Methylotuvimicrobium sp. KM1]|uniref:bifunctional diguanylate cyclase/phosphodiesterase n=1 Tax=Methylotuvimicrobium sp. KM1 TaxID=3377707 RepID=UPI00384FA4D4
MPSVKKQKQPSLSLVWKTILAVGFATALASGAIVLFGQFSLNQNYQQERSRVHRFYRQAFQGILEGIKNDRVDIGWLIPAFIDDKTSPQNALEVIDHFIDNNWFKIEVESDIESAFLFSTDGKLIASWGNTPYQGQFSEWLDYVITHESPFDNILCEERCVHFHATPFLHHGSFIGVFIFGIDLADTVLKMRDLTGSGISILTLPHEFTNPKKELLSIPPWQANIVALTDSERNIGLLNAFSRQYPDGIPDHPKIFKFENRTYEIIPFPFNGNNNTVLLIIEDISRGLDEIKKATALYAINGLLSLLLSGGVLLLLLIGPTQKLKRLIALLPLIAKKQYDLVAKLLLHSKKHSFFKDEIDVLEFASHQLISTLKQLDDEVNLRTQRLSEQALELQIEKNFIDNILNSAQVIIMTVDSVGRIKSVNQYAQYLLQYTEAELLNTDFVEFIPTEEHRGMIESSITQLLDKHNNTFQYECPIYSVDGAQLYISWFLSPLVLKELGIDADPEVLIVGLDLTDRRKSEKQLTWLAEHDPLTGLYNRRKFEKEFEHAINIANRYHHSSALIFFDVDQFKYVNDSSGHQIGDELLVKVAEKLRSFTRDTDVIARFGGDEFIVMAPEISQQAAEDLVQKICTGMTSVSITDNNQQHRVSVSAGLLMFPEPNCSAQDLLATADVAMYKAKESGRGGWRLANSEDIHRSEIKTKVNWKAKIEQALNDRQFKLFYQPIMHIRDKTISHYECLLRMIGSNDEIIPPGMFIEVAEQTGLIFQLDMCVVELAFVKQVELIEQGIDIRLSINLSGETLSNVDAFSKIDKLLRSYGLDAHKFIFEVTETQAVTNLQSAHEFINKINNIGGSFALDDFGVGFSSMSYLRQLPVEYLKIDGSFVKNINSSLDDQLFVNAINSVGQGMGLKTIAEFVENDAIFEKLGTLGVDYAQGYGIGKPMPFLEFHKNDDADY